MKNQSENKRDETFKVIFIVDPVRSDRIYMAKFIKHESFLVMSFNNIQDCFKSAHQIQPDLVVHTLRKKPQDLKKLQNIKRKFKKVSFILYLTKEVPEVNSTEFQETGFTSIYKAATQEKVREIIHEILSPNTLPRRAESPHPVPYKIADMTSMN